LNAQYGKTYVKNYQAQGTTNFNNSANKGDTQVDNLSGLAGSVQNFGLMELSAEDPTMKELIEQAEAKVKELEDMKKKDMILLHIDPSSERMKRIEELTKKLKGLKELIRGLRIKVDKIEAEIEKKSKKYKELKKKELAEAKKSWLCVNGEKMEDGSDKMFCRKLTDDEGKCYWILQADNAVDFSDDGLELNTENAAFVWNFEANSLEAIEGKTACKQFPSTMLPTDPFETGAEAKEEK